MDASAAEMVQVDFTLRLGEGEMSASVHVPAGEVTVTDLLPVLQAMSCRIVQEAEAMVHAAGETISCRAGCGACCRQLVPISIFEAEALGTWIRGLPEWQQDELRGRFHEALLALREAGILERLTPEIWGEGDAVPEKLALGYLAAKVPCPFLVEESCSIHPIRPLICREYVVTSPPEFCAAPWDNPVRGVLLPLKPSRALVRLGAKLENDPNGWLPLVLLFQWMKSGSEPGKKTIGPGPKVLYEMISQIKS